MNNLTTLLAERRALLVPGAANALSARIIADLNFQAVYLSGAGLTNTYLSVPDLSFIGLNELAQHTAVIRDAIDIPLIVDADTGFGNALNVYHSVRVLERSGANAIQLEDQIMPKRCGHFSGKALIPSGEMLGKIKAATDARHSADTLIIARTDGIAVEGFEAAIERARRYIEAGADVTFVEAPENFDQLRQIPRLLSVPQVANIVIGGKTPVMSQQQLAEAGFGLVLYANAALQGAIVGMQAALRELQTRGQLDEDSGLVAPFSERQRLVQKPLFDSLEQRYASDDPND
ncbi:MAG: isocitrate lyase/PEP mutase family protein [Gammaproteobacteria bacterium]